MSWRPNRTLRRTGLADSILVSQSRTAVGLLARTLGLPMLGLGLGSTLGLAVGVAVGRSVAPWPSSVDPSSVQALSSDAARRTANKLRLNGFRAGTPASGELSVSN